MSIQDNNFASTDPLCNTSIKINPFKCKTNQNMSNSNIPEEEEIVSTSIDVNLHKATINSFYFTVPHTAGYTYHNGGSIPGGND